MSKKDLFKSQNPDKFISSANIDKLKEQVESKNFIKEKVKQQKMFTPRVDFSDPVNFARYGLAEEYYRTSVENVYKTYPYDGSIAEKESWYNSGSYLDQYIFDKEYPRTNGYIIIGSDGSWGSKSDTKKLQEGGLDIASYGLPSNLEYITFNGGPHKSFQPAGERTKSLANYYKSSKNRVNNLRYDLSPTGSGVTVEFWLKKDGWDPSLTANEVIFDLWNSETTGSENTDYGRLRIELSASGHETAGADPLRVTFYSGSTNSGRYLAPDNGTLTTGSLADGNWHHYALVFQSGSNSGVGQTRIDYYRDGQFVAKTYGGFNHSSSIAGTMSASIGALVSAPSGSVYHSTGMSGYGKLYSASLDEFRYWKTARSAKQIYQNYNNQVGGGTNTDDSNTTLGIYYKFNEGVTTNDTVDATVLDYSGRVSNGSWIGYNSTSRSTGSAIVSSSTSAHEFQDPIIYNFHPSVSSVKDRLVNSGSFHDNENASALFYTLPSWILEGDESFGGSNLKYLTQIMSSYLDTLYLQIEELSKLKEVEHTSGSLKPSVFGNRLLSDKGLLAPELFVDADIVEQLYARNEKTTFTKDLSEIKNKIYENVYNNLVQIYKSKGTYESFRNVLNTLGISQKIVDINLYSNNAEYEILDNRRLVFERKKKLNLFKTDYNSATVYQATGSTGEGISYIPATSDNTGSFTPWTIESRFTLPRDNINSNYYFIENDNLSCSLFGFHRPEESNTNYDWASQDTTVQVFAVRDKASYKDGYFYLTSSILAAQPGYVLSSSIIPNLFDDTEWNLAVRFRPVKNPLETRVSGGLNAANFQKTNYTIEFKGASLRGDLVENEFLLSSSQFDHSYEGAGIFLSLTTPKRFYIGSHRLNYTGSIYKNGYSFAKFHNMNFWYNYISDDDVRSHLKDSRNYGVSKTYQPSADSFYESGYINSVYQSGADYRQPAAAGVPNIDTLVFRWDFETVSESNTSGQFDVLDITSGSTDWYSGRYGKFGEITNQYQFYGRGFGFTANATDVVKTERINSYKLANFDTITSEQMIEIRSEDDEIFLPDKRPIEYSFAAEKNFYGAINESIIETFATLKDFNNLIGESANRYRPEYKELKKYRQLFFERVQNELDFERFVDYYKWVDSSISYILTQLIPASADFSPGLSNVVESHILERNKYQHRLPVIKPMTAYETSLSVAPDSYFLSNKTVISGNLQNANPITSSAFLTASINKSSVNASTLSGSIENIVDLTYRNLISSSYISGNDDLNTINVVRTKSKNRKVGNYRENHSIVMIPNKDGNNDFLQDMFGSVASVSDSFFVSGVVDYTILTRPSQPSVITPRFSAPGGPEVASLGYLDYESTQYSVYNDMNYRNLVVRKALNEMRVSSSGDPTLFISASDAASYNHNYRNPRKEYMSGGINYGNTASVFYDNAFITHAIPASDLQYSWITASYESATFLTRQTGSEDITFYKWMPDMPPSYGDEIMPIGLPFPSVFQDLRPFASILDDDDGISPTKAFDGYGGIPNFPIQENLWSPLSMQLSIGSAGGYFPEENPLNTDYTPLAGGTAGAGGTAVNNQQAVRFIINYYSPRGFNTWTSIRASQLNPIIRIFNKNSILSVADPIRDKEIVDVRNGVRKRRVQKAIVPISLTNYIEPGITRKFRPLRYTFVENNVNNDVIEEQTSYAIHLAGFANKSLNSVLKGNTKKEVASYNRVKNLYLNSEDPENSPIKGWISVEYEEMVWPKEKFQGVNSHRDKPHYDSTPFPVIVKSRLGNQNNRTFWRDTASNRKRSTMWDDGVLGNTQNSLGKMYTSSLPLNTADGTYINGDNFSKNVFPLSDYSLASNSGSLGQVCQLKLTIATTVTSSAEAIFFDILTPDGSVSGPAIFASSFAGSPAVAAIALMKAINTDPVSNSVLTASLVLPDSIIVQTRYPVGVSGSDFKGLNNQNFGAKLNPVSNNVNTLGLGGVITPYGEIIPLTGGTAPIFNRDGELNSSFLANPGMTTGSGILEKYQAYREEGYFGTHGTSSAHYSHGVGVGDPYLYRPMYPYYYPQASQTYIHRPRPALVASTLKEVAPYSGHPWLVALSSSRNPFFNSYQDYIKSPKFLTENYSIIPEFNFSEHVEYYERSGSNFRAENKKLFNIAGSKGKLDRSLEDPSSYLYYGKYLNTASAESETGNYNSEFFKNYAHTEFLQNFDAVQQDHSKVGQIGEVTLICKGLTKFRPQQGFYPVQRCLQLGSLFSQSVEGRLSGYVSSSTKYGYPLEQFRIQSAIQPLFSPGIMYNTIKSGLAVDWPIIFSGSLTAVGTTGSSQIPSSSLLINSNASKRVPFEALSDLNSFPTNVDVLYLYPSYHSGTTNNVDGARRPSFNWDGNRNSTLYENAMDNFLAEVPNFYLKNKNFMSFTSDIEDQFKPFESSKTYYMDVSVRQTDNHFMWKDYFDGTIANAKSFVGSYNGRAFGPGWNTSSADPEAKRVGADPAYAPYVPPYFYGESIARFSFSPSSNRKYTLDEIIAGSTIEYLTPNLLTGVSSSTAVFSALPDGAGTPYYKNRMTLSSSFNLFGQVKTKPDSPDTSFNAWKISPKFECPVLNFNSQPSEEYMSRGMWGGLGSVASGSEGIFASIKNSFTGTVASNTGSLAEQLGFTRAQKKIGVLADAFVLEEAIVAIPFLERKSKNKGLAPSKETEAIEKVGDSMTPTLTSVPRQDSMESEAELTTIDKRNFFRIDRKIMKKQIESGEDTTITNMTKMMDKYVIPPNYNFMKYDDISPFVMYFFEFGTTFSQQDLAYMWQGVMPDASLDENEKFAEDTITHKTGPEEFYHGKEIPSDIRWLVFKVKKKARKSYSDVINLTDRDEQDYGYNWPYDYCSLVEMAKLDVSFKITPKKDVTKEDIVIGKVLKG